VRGGWVGTDIRHKIGKIFFGSLPLHEPLWSHTRCKLNPTRPRHPFEWLQTFGEFRVQLGKWIARRDRLRIDKTRFDTSAG